MGHGGKEVDAGLESLVQAVLSQRKDLGLTAGILRGMSQEQLLGYLGPVGEMSPLEIMKPRYADGRPLPHYRGVSVFRRGIGGRRRG